ncbi:MAG: antibiotic biosynthesis monooxygenase [Lentisphaerales bacterium]|nr:antibiotic biosynthesis monooxygenase [Lentisphaerales bacterium]
MSDIIYTIAELTAKDGQFEKLVEILTDLAHETRKESGVVEYIFIKDHSKENTILSYEKWKDEVAEKAHWDTEHLKSAIDKMGSVLKQSPIIHKGNQII